MERKWRISGKIETSTEYELWNDTFGLMYYLINWRFNWELKRLIRKIIDLDILIFDDIV